MRVAKCPYNQTLNDLLNPFKTSAKDYSPHFSPQLFQGNIVIYTCYLSTKGKLGVS